MWRILSCLGWKLSLNSSTALTNATCIYYLPCQQNGGYVALITTRKSTLTGLAWWSGFSTTWCPEERRVVELAALCTQPNNTWCADKNTACMSSFGTWLVGRFDGGGIRIHANTIFGMVLATLLVKYCWRLSAALYEFVFTDHCQVRFPCFVDSVSRIGKKANAK